MSYTYIYLYSFKETNNVYIGKTTNIKQRVADHKRNPLSPIKIYVNEKFNNDWSNVYIDIIDAIDMNADLSYLFDDPLNKTILNDYKYITQTAKTQEELVKQKIIYTEYYYIQKYYRDSQYTVLNTSLGFNCDELYEFYKRNDLNTFVKYRYSMDKQSKVDSKSKHAEYQRKYRERKMKEIGEEEYKQIEKKKAINRNITKFQQILKEEKEVLLLEQLNAIKIANEPVVKKGRGRPKKDLN
jgi:hypothetical protein